MKVKNYGPKDPLEERRSRVITSCCKELLESSDDTNNINILTVACKVRAKRLYMSLSTPRTGIVMALKNLVRETCSRGSVGAWGE